MAETLNTIDRTDRTKQREPRKPINRFSEEQLLRVASTITSASPGNILLLGGGAALSEIAGYQRLRGRSDDLDFIANDQGLEALARQHDMKPWHVEGTGYATFVSDVFVCVFHPTVHGLVVDASVYLAAIVRQTGQGPVHTVPVETNLAMKIRRGASRDQPHIYGKDGIDAATMVTGLRVLNTPFDHASFGAAMQRTCESCRLGEPLACLDAIERYGSQQLPRKERPYFEGVVAICKRELEQQCRYK